LSQKSEITNIFYDLREVSIVNNFKIKPVHKLVLFVLESRGNQINPSKKTIAKDCGYSKATVDKALKDLQKAGLVKIRRQFNSSNWYYLNKKVFTDEANKIRSHNALLKAQNDAHKDRNYDPWEEDSNQEIFVNLVDEELNLNDDNSFVSEDVLKEVWGTLNSISNPS
jgi:predicted transcriptional regulator